MRIGREMTLVAALAATMALTGPVARAQLPDPRIETVDYDAGRVVTLRATQGYAVVVDLGPDEHIDNVVVGDSAGWQVTANKRGDHVVVKPLAVAAATDMVIVTGERSFVFLLQPADAGAGPFVIRFRYLAPAAETPAPVLAAYRFRGARALFPIAMYDDGRHTTIAWGKDTPLPAVFAVEGGGKQRIVNGRFRGADYVIDDVAPIFVFRVDKRTAFATRAPLKPFK